jgi:isoquinoline 1-oxidoreductase beta subunit
LIGSGVAGLGLALGVTMGIPYARLKLVEMLDAAGGPPGRFASDPFAWFEVLPDSRIRLYLSKVEMGQGIHTSLAQIALEELGIAWADLDVAQATTTVGPADATGTNGSSSVSTVYTPLRETAATLRDLLLQEAASLLNRPAATLTVIGRGFGTPGSDGPQVTFAEIVDRHQGEWQLPDDPPPLKEFSTFQVIGQPLPRVDIPAKVTGQAIYGYDMRLDGMKYGAVARPATIEGTLRAAQAGQAGAQPGVKAVVLEDGFAGVVADSRAQAHAALAHLDLTWDEGKLWQQEEIDKLITAGGPGGVTIQRAGNVERGLRNGAFLEAEYRTPFAVQTPLEAQAALADVRPDRVRIWVSTQVQAQARTVFAEALAVDEAIIEVIPTYLGGGFGRKIGFDVGLEAARLSKAAGVPVHVGWTRNEELRYGYFRPPTHSLLRARLADNGRIEAWQHHQASGEVAARFLPAWMVSILGADFGSYRGALLRYAVPNHETVAWHKQLPVATGWWRGLGLLANTFAIESFIDELAHLAGRDPLQYRLDHLPNDALGQRMARVLNAAAEKAGWGGSLPAGRALGVACSSDVGTVVAEIAEVSVDPVSGRPRIHRVTAAMDCGLTINPDGARAQIEGNIMWGIGSTLIEEIRIKDGQIDVNNFDTYPLLTMHDAPEVDTILLEAGDGQPRGVGEPPIAPVAAAIGNALFRLTGQRYRRLPIKG